MRSALAQHQRVALAATAPAAAPSANHFAARAIRRRALPPWRRGRLRRALWSVQWFCLFVGQVTLSGGQFGLAGLAVQGEVVQGL